MTLTRLSKPMIRIVTDRKLVVRITEKGIEIRRYRQRKWQSFSWEQIASLTNDDFPVLKAIESATGAERLKQMGVK